jgi:hypothetical protein
VKERRIQLGAQHVAPLGIPDVRRTGIPAVVRERLKV